MDATYASQQPAFRGGGGGSPPAALSTTGLLFRHSSAFSAVTTTTDGGGRTVLTQMNDMIAAAHLTSSGTEHPVLMTDRQGRPFWRFNSLAWASFVTASAINYQSNCLYFVGRMHRPSNLNSGVTNIIYLAGYATHAHMNVAPTNTTPFLRLVNGNTQNNVGREKAIAGSQLQVLVVRSNGGSGSAISVGVNQDLLTISGFAAVGSGSGGQIGAAAGGANLGGFDLYEIAGYTSGFANTDINGTVPGDPVNGGNVGKLMAFYNIAPITRSIALEGDSRSFGYGNGATAADYGNGAVIPSGDCLAVQLAMNSSNNDVRIVSVAATGNRIDDLVTQRDTLRSIQNSTGGFVSGWQNDIHFLVGTNDQIQPLASGTPVWTTLPSTAARADEAMDRATWGMIPYINTTTTGLLQRGMRVYVSTEIAKNAAADMVALNQFRTRVSDPAFLTSCDAHAGGTYPGKVIVNALDAWTDGGSTVFSTQADAADTIYYNNDGLHLRAEGTRQYALSIRGALGLSAA